MNQKNRRASSKLDTAGFIFADGEAQAHNSHPGARQPFGGAAS
jgi:hypothetical protein